MLWCYSEDKGGWGEKLKVEAENIGMKAALFGEDDSDRPQKGDVVFMRIPQWKPELDTGKAIAQKLYHRGCHLIPDIKTIQLYEDKWAQSERYFQYMPPTVLLRFGDFQYAMAWLSRVEFPFISKSSLASASANVRLVRNHDEAMKEFKAAMNGEGIPMKIGKGREARQIGYLIWQKFCKDNSHDYRVVRCGNYYMMLFRGNKPGTVFASGSGVNRPVVNPDRHENRALETARHFFETENIRFGGIDLVYDKEEKRWMVLETTLGWSQDAYKDCPFFGTPFRGEDMFRLLALSINEGQV